MSLVLVILFSHFQSELIVNEVVKVNFQCNIYIFPNLKILNISCHCDLSVKTYGGFFRFHKSLERTALKCVHVFP